VVLASVCSEVQCRWFTYGPADATATPPSLALLKSRPFWYRLTHRLSWKRGQVPVLTAGNNYWDSLVWVQRMWYPLKPMYLAWTVLHYSSFAISDARWCIKSKWAGYGLQTLNHRQVHALMFSLHTLIASLNDLLNVGKDRTGVLVRRGQGRFGRRPIDSISAKRPPAVIKGERTHGRDDATAEFTLATSGRLCGVHKPKSGPPVRPRWIVN